MAHLVRVDIPEVLTRIAAVCARDPAIAAAYLFGSALGELRPDSDIDVAVILMPDVVVSGWGPEGAWEAELGRFDGHPLQVTVLTLREPIFAVMALRENRLAYTRDAGALTDFLERAALRNWQNRWHYWSGVREVNGWDPHPTRSASPEAPRT